MSMPKLVVSGHHDGASSSSGWTTTSSESSPPSQPPNTDPQPGTDIEFGDFELPPPLPPRSMPNPEIESQSQPLRPPSSPSRSMLKSVSFEPNQGSGYSEARPIPAAPFALNAAVLSTEAGNEGGDIQAVNHIRTNPEHTLYQHIQIKQMPTSYYVPATGMVRTLEEGRRRAKAIEAERGSAETRNGATRIGKAGDCELISTEQGGGRVDAGESEKTCAERARQEAGDCELVATEQVGATVETRQKRKRCCCCKSPKVVVLIILRVLCCLFAGFVITTFAIMFATQFANLWPYVSPLLLAELITASILLFFNFCVLSAQCCTRSRRVRKSKPYTYTLLIMDFSLSLALMVVGVFNIIAQLMVANEMSTWRMTHGYMPGDSNTGQHMAMGLAWMSVGLFEGICGGIGAVDLWA